MSDGGRDISGSEGELAVIFQVKWTSKALQNPVTWLRSAVEAERANIERLIREEGATEYRLMTCVAGTSTPKTGTIDRLDEELNKLSEQYGVRMRCMWQSDLDSMVDSAPTQPSGLTPRCSLGKISFATWSTGLKPKGAPPTCTAYLE